MLEGGTSNLKHPTTIRRSKGWGADTESTYVCQQSRHVPINPYHTSTHSVHLLEASHLRPSRRDLVSARDEGTAHLKTRTNEDKVSSPRVYRGRKATH